MVQSKFPLEDKFSSAPNCFLTCLPAPAFWLHYCQSRVNVLVCSCGTRNTARTGEEILSLDLCSSHLLRFELLTEMQG